MTMAAIVVAAMVSAKDGKTKRINVEKKEARHLPMKESKNILKSVNSTKIEENLCVAYTSSCGVSAMTCATGNWTSISDWKNWESLIETNYCKPGHPYSNTSGLQP